MPPFPLPMLVFNLLELESAFISLLLKLKKTITLFTVPFLLCISAPLCMCFSLNAISFRVPSYILVPPLPAQCLFTKSFLHSFSPFPILFLLPSLLLTTFLFAFQPMLFRCPTISSLSSDAFWIEHLADACNGDVFSIRRNRIDFIRPDFVPRLRPVYLPSVVRVDDFKDADDSAIRVKNCYVGRFV